MIVPLQVKEAMIIMGGLFIQVVVFASLMAKPLLDGGVISRSPHGRIDVMFGPVVTTEAHLAFSGARIHSNNTAEMTAMIEALSFLGPHGPAAQDGQSCIYNDSTHAAGICLGTIQARTHVQLALACQQSLIHAQRWLRLTMQHVYGHSGNLGNECADHAAALGTFGLIPNHNVATRWIHQNFDSLTRSSRPTTCKEPTVAQLPRAYIWKNQNDACLVPCVGSHLSDDVSGFPTSSGHASSLPVAPTKDFFNHVTNLPNYCQTDGF